MKVQLTVELELTSEQLLALLSNKVGAEPLPSLDKLIDQVAAGVSIPTQSQIKPGVQLDVSSLTDDPEMIPLDILVEEWPGHSLLKEISENGTVEEREAMSILYSNMDISGLSQDKIGELYRQLHVNLVRVKAASAAG